MTHALSPKVGAALLRTAFQDKGAVITHTEALDLLAKLEGYKAWSHMQQALKPEKVVTVKPTKTRKEACLRDILIAHYGRQNDWPAYPRVHFSRTLVDDDQYWKDAIEAAEEDGLLDGREMFDVGQAIPVTLPDGTATTWNIEQNLTTRCGELNGHNRQGKAGLALLELDRPLFDKLVTQMPRGYELAFAVRKDGEFGLLYEEEYCSQESEARSDSDVSEFKSHADVVAALWNGLTSLAPQYPAIQFCVPDAAQVIHDRPAVWAFVKLDALAEAERVALADAICNL